MSYSKKYISTFIREAINARPNTVVKYFETAPLQEVKVHEPNFNTYTAIQINPYTLEEQLIMYPTVVVHDMPRPAYVIIDIE